MTHLTTKLSVSGCSVGPQGRSSLGTGDRCPAPRKTLGSLYAGDANSRDTSSSGTFHAEVLEIGVKPVE